MSHMNSSWHMWIRPVTFEYVMSHIRWVSNESYQNAYNLYHIWIRHVTYEYVMSNMNTICQTWIRNVTFEHVTSRLNRVIMSHVTNAWVMSRTRWVGCWTSSSRRRIGALWKSPSACESHCNAHCNTLQHTATLCKPQLEIAVCLYVALRRPL